MPEMPPKKPKEEPELEASTEPTGRLRLVTVAWTVDGKTSELTVAEKQLEAEVKRILDRADEIVISKK